MISNPHYKSTEKLLSKYSFVSKLSDDMDFLGLILLFFCILPLWQKVHAAHFMFMLFMLCLCVTTLTEIFEKMAAALAHFVHNGVQII